MKYLFSQLQDIGDPTRDDWLSADRSRFEIPIAELARRNGASPAFVGILVLGHDLAGMSALQFLRDTALGAATKEWFTIRGGNDRLPKAIAALLSDSIRSGSPVIRLAQDDRAVHVTCRRGDMAVTLSGDYVVAAVPAPLMASIDMSPALPDATRSALREIGSLAMARAFVQTNRRFWLDRGDTGWALTDDPLDIWEYTRQQPGPRGILGAYMSGRIARTSAG